MIDQTRSYREIRRGLVDSWTVSYNSAQRGCVARNESQDGQSKSELGSGVVHSEEWKKWEEMIKTSGDISGTEVMEAPGLAVGVERVFREDAERRLKEGRF
uniref:Uncharacterized protein n=1 Tax=Kwoniella bestiolae CBS 10118 TaxID=1296100 RepID=A0A1B9FZ26_9TREE|nr:hypothetical protein I302_07013 [Kwoniella bestiolae CBS 10118]OCF24027.1 hypothetical protein I302_07013 [Kwoniella bestiolae CBS 10118]